MTQAPLPPGPVLKSLPSGRQIYLPTNNDISLCILQGLMRTRSHILPTGRWSDLEQLLWEPAPPTPGPFYGSFRRWAKNMCPRSMKERVVALLNFHGVYDPTAVTNPSRLQSTAKQFKNEMDHAKAVRRAALNAECARQESCQRKNVRQEGALGALSQGYGVVAPHVAGAKDELLHRNQDACDLLAQNPRSKNDHFRPIFLVDVPPRVQAQPGAVHAGMVVTPVPAGAVEEGANQPPTAVFQLGAQQAAPPQLPTLGKFAAMAMPPPAHNAGA
jgi:hypothetical protein